MDQETSEMTDEVLIQVKPWLVTQKQLHSASFRAEKLNQTKRAVLLRLKDGREVWFPWSAIENMEWAKQPNPQTQKPNHHGHLNHSTNSKEVRRQASW